MIQEVFGSICLVWYMVIVTVATLGFLSIRSNFAVPLAPKQTPYDVEPVTIIRPIKGVDPELTTCLELSFLQKYPVERLQILFCVADRNDPAIPILQQLVQKYPHIDAQILISEPDTDHYGPNPKVNNLAKGFLAAKYDLLWIMDLNVWALADILLSSVQTMNENLNCNEPVKDGGRRVKLVHHVPLALSLDDLRYGKGSLLDEMFLFTSHLKFYVSLNNASIAPCVNGKSNMYRKSDLDYAVSQIPVKKSPFFLESSVVDDAARISFKGPGHSIEFFAKYIGEDNMIAIALWEYCYGRTALTGDVVIQPLEAQDQQNSVFEYCNRRVRWLRVRKYMVLAATLVEPTTESIICGLMGTFGMCTTFWGTTFSMKLFLLHLTCWLIADYDQYYRWIENINRTGCKPHWLQNIAPNERSKSKWLQIWLMREIFALPIWVAAMCGHTINWRGKPFMIKKDLSASEL
ncbi:hypothetical protein PUMCH_000812 [Australozyma saopauloensis]|uniref:Ceramide glucosyltransferase n=1 Tax=Australozyma saopauloensis TaxID=291208 RepID=A0AAX4H5R2_9ASCO|nr:hypothetical protein PUMCH_000812 [[Candida] saopauloensis]